MKLTSGSYSKALLSSSVVKNEQRFACQKILYFPFNANISNDAVVAGDSVDSDVVAGDILSYVSSSSLLLLLAAVRHSASA